MGRLKYPELRTMYKLDRKIGEGGFAKVRLATHLLTGEKVAIKIMEKAALGRDLRRVLSEVDALKTLTHQYIAQVYQIIDSDEHIFIIMEYCSGGELFDYIVHQKRLSEAEARGFFRQILSAVAFLHKKGYAHRDLKPENILLDSDHNLKLIDFGLCAKPYGGISTCLRTACGSLNYAAPELLLGVRYLGPQADVWSLGVLLYALLCGALPFDESQGMAGELQRKIITGTYDEPEHLSQLSREMIRGMLQKDPRLRLTTDQLLSHKWVTLECYDPVCYRPIHEHHERNDQVLQALSDYYNTSVDGVWQRLSSWSYDYFTACYLLLLNKKRRGLRFTLGGPCTPVKVRATLRERQSLQLPESNLALSAVKSPLSPSHPSYSKMVEHMQDKESDNFSVISTDADEFSSSDKNTQSVNDILSGTSQMSMENKLHLGLGSSSVSVSHPYGTKSDQVGDSPGIVTRSRSRKRGHDSSLDFINLPRTSTPLATTPVMKRRRISGVGSENKTPPSASGKFLHSVERKLNRMKNMLTPKKADYSTPATLNAKDLHDVSVTSMNDPKQVLDGLTGALSRCNIQCKARGYLIRGKVFEESVALKKSPNCVLIFELEVCWIKSEQRAPLVGIRRKRLKGDTFYYKKVCEQILQLTVK